MTIRVSEVFCSIQGEGIRIGRLSVWVRFYGCNLECNGMGQSNPTDPSTHILPYKTIDLSSIKKMSDLPVFNYGCDSSYSWSTKFKHLIEKYTASEIVDKIYHLVKESFGVDIYKDNWIHPLTRSGVQLCFTGGEPMMHQKSMNEIMAEFKSRNSEPFLVTIETNATKSVKEFNLDRSELVCLHMSCSPKLYYVSGEKDAVRFDIIEDYYRIAYSGILKFVHNGSKEAWDELDSYNEQIMKFIKSTHGMWSVCIMPVGSTVEDQNSKHIERIAVEAMKRGYEVSPRAHIQLFGNAMGT